jgi:hypothetical protein
VAGATGAVARAAPQAPKWVLQHAIARPIGWALRMLGKPAEMTEHAVTSGKGYDAWLGSVEDAAAKRGIPIQKMTPQQRGIAAEALRVILDPTNLLMFPGPIAKGVAVGGRAVQKAVTIGARVADDAHSLAYAHGLDGILARSHAALEAGLAAKPMQYVRGALVGAHQHMAELTDATYRVFDRAYGLGEAAPRVRQILREWHGDLFGASDSAKRLNFQLLRDLPDPVHREQLYHVFDGGIAEADIPEHLQGAWKSAKAAIDAQTTRATEGGYIEHARDNYIKHVYPAEDIERIKKFRSAPTPAGAAGAQIRAGPRPLGTTIKAAKQRTFLTSLEAQAAGLHPIMDTAVSIPLHHLELGMAEANTKLLQKVAGLGEEWVQASHEAPAGWKSFGEILGNPTAERTIAEDGHRLSDLRMRPELAEWMRDLTTRTGLSNNKLAQIGGRILSGYKRATFYFPTVHGWNVMRSAYLADGLRAFNPARWREMMLDGEGMGQWTRRYLAGGGTLGTGPTREYYSVVDQIMQQPEARKALLRDGLSWKTIRNVVFEGPGVAKEKADDFLWNKLDRGMRLGVFRHFVEGGHSDEEAARLATSFLNNYSRATMTDMEKKIAGLFFTYSWNKGRLQLFGNMARSMVPGTALSAGERAIYQAATARWAVTNLLMPHIARAAMHQASAGVYGANIPAGFKERNSYRTPLYWDPTGFYSDAAQFIAHPGTWTLTRLSPAFRVPYEAFKAAETARQTGQSEYEAALSVLARNVPIPAGIPQAFTAGAPPLARAAAALGLPTHTSPPPPEDPHMLMYEAIQRGDYAEAAQLIKTHQMGFRKTVEQLPPEARRPLMQMYQHLFPPQTGMPGLPREGAAGGTRMPGLPKGL